MPAIAKDVTGVRSGSLVATKIVGKRGSSNLWECVCDCGEKTTAIATQILRGEKTSCGCKKKMPRKPRPDLVIRNKGNATHGMTKSKTYSTWKAMRARCENENDKDYKNYGGRGIQVCQRWSQSFFNFLDDMGERPVGHTIDRIDVNGHYDPSNCRWATPREQGNNTRMNVLLTNEGRTMTVSEWAKEKGVETKTLLYRVKNGWDVDKALNTPSLIKRK